MSEEDRPRELGRYDIEQWFRTAHENARRGALETVLKGLSPEIKDEAIDKEIDRFIRTSSKLTPERAVALALAINEKLALPRKVDVIVGMLRSIEPRRRVPEVMDKVVDKLIDEGFLTPGFFSLSQWAPRFSQEEQRETDYSVVEVHFTERAYDVIKELMNKSRTASSLSEVLTQALAFEKWYRDAVAANYRVLIERGRGEFRDVKRP